MADAGLNRFVQAQAGEYEQAISEIRSGRKRSHWMWYIFPQYAGLGSSSMSRQYAIKSIAEAKAYLRHPVLGPRLVECTEAALGVETQSAYAVFGSPDDMKLRSCATLFACVSPAGSVFERLLDKYFSGERDHKTLRLLHAGMTRRDVRCQAAVTEEGRLLLIRCVLHSGGAFWILPGGGPEEGESDEACVKREVREEAGLDVAVGPILYEIPAEPPNGTYKRWRTYACRITGGDAAPGGGEHEADVVAVRWLSLGEPAAWDADLCADPFLYPQLLRIRAALAQLR